jgi:hypothetical protein
VLFEDDLRGAISSTDMAFDEVAPKVMSFAAMHSSYMQNQVTEHTSLGPGLRRGGSKGASRALLMMRIRWLDSAYRSCAPSAEVRREYGVLTSYQQSVHVNATIRSASRLILHYTGPHLEPLAIASAPPTKR